MKVVLRQVGQQLRNIKLQPQAILNKEEVTGWFVSGVVALLPTDKAKGKVKQINAKKEVKDGLRDDWH